MIFSNVVTHYINSNKDSRLVRYDVIKVDDDTFVVNVTHEAHNSVAPAGAIAEISTFKITREDYRSENDIGSVSVVRNQMATTFEGHVLVKCQQHRDSLD